MSPTAHPRIALHSPALFRLPRLIKSSSNHPERDRFIRVPAIILRAPIASPPCVLRAHDLPGFFFLQNLCLQPRRPYSVGRCLSRSTSYFFLFVSFPALRALASFPFALCATHLHPPQRVWFCGRPNLIYCCCDLSFLAFHSSGHLHPDPTSPPVSLPDHPTAPCLLHTATPHCVFSCFAAHSQAARKPFLLLTHG